jgi:hypothetical protein
VRRTGDADGRSVLLGMGLKAMPPEKQAPVIGHVSAYQSEQFRVRAGARQKRLRQGANEVADGSIYRPDLVGGRHNP